MLPTHRMIRPLLAGSAVVSLSAGFPVAVAQEVADTALAAETPAAVEAALASAGEPIPDPEKQDERVVEAGVDTRNEADRPTEATAPIIRPVEETDNNNLGEGDADVTGIDTDEPVLRGDDNPQAGDTPAADGNFGSPAVPFDRGTSGKAVGSGKWGYVGDLQVSGTGDANMLPNPHLYGLDINEKTGELVVTSNGKCNTVACFGDAGVYTFDVTDPAYAGAQYQGNGYYGATNDEGADGVGTSFSAPISLAPAPGTQWRSPRGVYVDDSDGSIYVVDSSAGLNPIFTGGGRTNHISQYDSDGNFVRSFGGPVGSGPGSLNNPYGISGYGDELYVASMNDQAVKVYSKDGTYLRQFPTTQSPWGLDVDEKTGDVYVATFQYQRSVRVYDNQGNLKGDIVIPTDIQRDAAGNLLPTDNAAGNHDAFLDRGQAFGVKIDQEHDLVMVWDQNGYDRDPFMNVTADDVANYRDKGGRVWFYKLGDLNPDSKTNPEKNPTPVDVLQLDQVEPGTVWNGSMGKQSPRGAVMDKNGLVYATTQQWDGNDRDPREISRVQIYGKTPDPVRDAKANMFTNVTTVNGVDEAEAVAIIRWVDPERTSFDHQPELKEVVIEYSTDGGATWTQYEKSASRGTNEVYVAVPDAKRNETYYFRLTPFNEAGSGDPVIVAAGLPNPALTIDKTGVLGDTNGNGRADEGEEITYTITVNAQGDPVSGVEVVDPMLGGMTCEGQDGIDPLNILELDETLTCTGTHTVTAEDIVAAGADADATIDNTATADGFDPLFPDVAVNPVQDTFSVDAGSKKPADPVGPRDPHNPTPPAPVIPVPPMTPVVPGAPGQAVFVTVDSPAAGAPGQAPDVAGAQPQTIGRAVLASTGVSAMSTLVALAGLSLLLGAAFIVASRRRD